MSFHLCDIPRILSLITLLAFIGCTIDPMQSSSAFTYQANAGVVTGPDNRSLVLEIGNPDLKQGTKIMIVTNLNGNQILRIARIKSKKAIASTESQSLMATYPLYTYELKPILKKSLYAIFGIGLVEAKRAFETQKGKISTYLDDDLIPEFFYQCTSQEGIHLIIRSGSYDKGEKKWHRYISLGYDLESPCNEADLK
ncbi:hypothetical protein KAR10_05680 [bacterium]|nr:hypothetical protein [bacterium]